MMKKEERTSIVSVALALGPMTATPLRNDLGSGRSFSSFFRSTIDSRAAFIIEKTCLSEGIAYRESTRYTNLKSEFGVFLGVYNRGRNALVGLHFGGIPHAKLKTLLEQTLHRLPQLMFWYKQS